MAISNHERIGRALELLRKGLAPFVDREVHASWKAGRLDQDRVLRVAEDPGLKGKKIVEWDVSALTKVMIGVWNDVFRQTLGPAERSYVSEVREFRNHWAHQRPFSSDDADRALDTFQRLLAAVSAPEADDVGRMKAELRRVVFDEQARAERRKSTASLIESQASGSLKAWRDVVQPHPDVASGKYQQAEFAADIWQVHLGEGSPEYRDPAEFFRRTYLTRSLSDLLISGMRRLTGAGGDPVVQLQTNFGGGKTHSMLALYHLFSGATAGDLTGVDELMAQAEVKALPTGVRKAVLVGNKISPGNPSVKPDGTVVNTLWGELAWQLGGKAAYDRIAADDQRGTSPGDALREIMNAHAPCLILIDEWVAYARQLHDESELPAGSFETHFSFAQALTESAKLADRCLLVISLPASDTAASPHAQADDEEVGGIRGRTALIRLKNVIGRLESSWSPATPEEGFEIVRRRLFHPLVEREQYTGRDNVARAFAELYRSQSQEFPHEVRDPGYEQRIRAAYPIHPEVFDRLYGDWSTLVKFQRTRGVLRLMASVIHALWEKGDQNPLIMPANIPIDDLRVRDELTRYLADNWKPIIESDVDGTNALPLRIDGENPNLGRYSAARRVARTIYLGSAPTATASNRGVEDRRIKLGCVMPGEASAIFGDALRRLGAAATYLYVDGARYWYGTQPTVTKLAEDRAEQFRREPDKVAEEITTRLNADLRSHGDFRRVHVMPPAGADVADDMDARLVVLGVDHPFSKDAANRARAAAAAILETRGTAPRLFQNTLSFLAVDQARLQDLDEAVRKYRAWRSILDDKEVLNLDPHQVRQAEAQLSSANGIVAARLPEAYQWLLVPIQTDPAAPISWETYKLSGQDALALRASKKLKSEELLIPVLAGTRLRDEMDRVPLWRDGANHILVRQLQEDFARYAYLPRLTGPDVLVGAIKDGVSAMLWREEGFAYADGYDEAKKRYRGLKCGSQLEFVDEAAGLVVQSEAAERQRQEDIRPRPEDGRDRETITGGGDDPDPGGGGGGDTELPSPDPIVTRFFGSVELDASRVGRDAGRIAEEVIAHLSGLVHADVKVTLEIEARLPEGAPENVVRTVTENSRTLKFIASGFEKDP